MAIYPLSMKPIPRGGGRSAVASAAYRACQKLTNERDGLTHDFTRKRGLEHAEIVIPKDSKADWAKDRSTLWNMAEAAEKRKDARVAREIEADRASAPIGFTLGAASFGHGVSLFDGLGEADRRLYQRRAIDRAPSSGAADRVS